MRHARLAILMLGFAVPVASAQGPVAAATPTPWANKFFVKDNTPAVLTHDFGTVPQGTMLTHKMTITNIYDVPMQVIDVRKSCTCLEAVLPTQVLQPHETAELTLQMNTAKFTGANAQTFFVTFGPQYVSTAVIRVSATSRADVTMSPGTANFGVVALGAKPSQTINVKYTGKQRDWKITGVVPPTGPFEVQVKEMGRGGLLGGGLLGGSGPEFAVTVSLKDGVQPGPISETISLKTSDPTAAVFVINVTGTVQAPVTVSPGIVKFDGKVGVALEQKVMVRATKQFKVQSIADSGDGLSVDAFPTAAPVQIVTVKLTPKTAGKLNKSLTLLTELGPVTIQIEGDVKE
ncbi:DUF1573 domain-containing protein [soil metagenome]